jgi:hypothetical protein
MNASDLLVKIRDLIAKHGDLEIAINSEEGFAPFPMNNIVFHEDSEDYRNQIIKEGFEINMPRKYFLIR